MTVLHQALIKDFANWRETTRMRHSPDFWKRQERTVDGHLAFGDVSHLLYGLFVSRRGFFL